MYQQFLFDTEEFSDTEESEKIRSRSGCFVDNMKLPVHRWYRYSAGFSADWVRSVLKRRGMSGTDQIVLDPFSGIATTSIACNSEKVRSLGLESHPFVYRIAEAKLHICRHSVTYLERLFSDFMRKWECNNSFRIQSDVPLLLDKCYDKSSLHDLLSMKHFLKESDMKQENAQILWFVITSILRSCSCVGTAQWQYVLPNKTKSNVRSPSVAYREKTTQILEDVVRLKQNKTPLLADIIYTDARGDLAMNDDSVDFVLTSPPYPNNYDYADATRLEMTFWGEVGGWADLHSAVRNKLLCSCTQHSSAERMDIHKLLAEPILLPIRSEIEAACDTLGEVRLQKGGKKTYHTMVAAYFRDLALVFRNLRRVCRSGGEMCFVIGDSAPYGVYIPVDEWLGTLAVAAGFHSYQFEKVRDRNIKWKNRKHDVPLKEGRLWIQG